MEDIQRRILGHPLPCHYPWRNSDSGFFTPTEAAVISVVYSFIIGVFVYKELDIKGAYQSFKDAIVVNGATTFMVGFSTVFAAFLTMAQIPNMIAPGILRTDRKCDTDSFDY